MWNNNSQTKCVFSHCQSQIHGYNIAVQIHTPGLTSGNYESNKKFEFNNHDGLPLSKTQLVFQGGNKKIFSLKDY